jgi:hypothetical protein
MAASTPKIGEIQARLLNIIIFGPLGGHGVTALLE